MKPENWRTGAVPGWTLPALALFMSLSGLDHPGIFVIAVVLLTPTVLTVWTLQRMPQREDDDDDDDDEGPLAPA